MAHLKKSGTLTVLHYVDFRNRRKRFDKHRQKNAAHPFGQAAYIRISRRAAHQAPQQAQESSQRVPRPGSW